MAATVSTVRFWVCFLIILIGASLAPRAFADDLGPPVGIVAPDIGTRLDQTGKPRALADLMGRNGLVLMFFRSADWCPFCRAQLIDVNGGAAEIEKRGYRIAALSYDTPEILQTFTNMEYQLHVSVGPEVGGDRPLQAA